jgi:acetyl-CoA carboxylase biotin carboxyl carrier protein
MSQVRAPLPGLFYRSPQPGAPPFVETGSRVDEDTVVGIIETMKLMTSVQAGVRGTVDAILLEDSRFVEKDGVLMRIVADSG